MDLKIISEIAENSLKFDSRPQELKDLIRRPESFRYYNFLSEAARAFNPELIVELGTNRGVSALHFRHGNKNSRIISIDIRQSAEVKSKLIKECIIPIEMDSIKAAERISSGIGILFVDSLHTFEHVQKEILAYIPKMMKPSLIFMDDILLDTGMKAAWDAIISFDKIVIMELHPTTGFGIVIVK